MIKILCLIAVAVAASGCASKNTKTSEELSASVGSPPELSDVKKAVLERLSFTLKDPSSIMQFEVTNYPVPVTWYRGLLHGGGYESGWMVCYQFNAKNGYGGYVGLQSEAVVVIKINGAAFIIPRVNWANIDKRCN